MDNVIHLLSLVALVSGLAVGTFALVSSRRQPEKAAQLRGVGALFFGIAGWPVPHGTAQKVPDNPRHGRLLTPS